jgi:hypothetical protein
MRPDAEWILARHEKSPQTWEGPLAAELSASNADADANLIAAARFLMALVDAQGSQADKYTVDVQRSHGVLLGDYGSQENVYIETYIYNQAIPGSLNESPAAAEAEAEVHTPAYTSQYREALPASSPEVVYYMDMLKNNVSILGRNQAADWLADHGHSGPGIDYYTDILENNASILGRNQAAEWLADHGCLEPAIDYYTDMLKNNVSILARNQAAEWLATHRPRSS